MKSPKNVIHASALNLHTSLPPFPLLQCKVYTALHTVFVVNVVRSIGQVDEMEFDEIGQRAQFT